LDQAIELSRFPKIFNNQHFNLKAVQTGTGTHKDEAGAETFWKSGSALKSKQIVSAPQHWDQLNLEPSSAQLNFEHCFDQLNLELCFGHQKCFLGTETGWLERKELSAA
jgi:hypothetical protein